MVVEVNKITKQCCDKNIPDLDPSQTKTLLNLEERHIDKVFFRSNGCWTDVRDREFEMSHYRQIYKQISDKQVI